MGERAFLSEGWRIKKGLWEFLGEEDRVPSGKGA